jgi:Domain of unknown function (DUF6285)
MQDEPGADELVVVVAEFLRKDVLPALEGRLGFDVRVAANALDLVARELVLGPKTALAEARRLGDLLGISGDVADLNRELCKRIRDGRVPRGAPGLLEHLQATTLDKLAIDQPGYATFRHVLEAGWSQSGEELWPHDINKQDRLA